MGACRTKRGDATHDASGWRELGARARDLHFNSLLPASLEPDVFTMRSGQQHLARYFYFSIAFQSYSLAYFDPQNFEVSNPEIQLSWPAIGLQPEPESMLSSLAGCRIGHTFDTLSAIQFLIQSSQHYPKHKRSTNCDRREQAVVDEGGLVSGRSRVGVQIRGIDRSRVRNRVDEGKGCRSLGWRARKGVADPRKCRGVAAVQA